MNIKQILCECIEKATNNQPIPKTYEEHQTILSNTYHFHADEQHRILYDLVTLTGWHIGVDCVQEFFYAHLSAPAFYAWKIPFPNGMRCADHAHNHIELTYVVNGTLKIHVEDKDLTLSQGELLLINAGIFHGEYLYNEECTLLYLGVDDSFFEQFINGSDSFDYTLALKNLINQKRSQYLYVRFSPIGETPSMVQAFTTILTELQSNLPGKKRLVIGSVERILDLLTKEFHMQVTADDAADLHHALVLDIQSYVNHHFADVSVSEIGEIFHYNPDYLNRIFRKAGYGTLSSYIQNIRLTEALRLIETTDDSIEKIAGKIGYHNQGFFYQKFKEKFQILPGDIRKKK